jgi:hypothetical protein
MYLFATSSCLVANFVHDFVVSAVVVCMLTDIALPVSDMIPALSDAQIIARPLPQIC